MSDHETVMHDAINLSDGTLATLTGRRSFAELEQIQAAFVAFVERHPGQYETWIKAWRVFQEQGLR